MTFLHSKRPLPRSWSRLHRGIVAETDISPSRGGDLRAKLLIFRTARDLREFWKKRIKNDLSRGTVAAVNGLWRTGELHRRDERVERWMEADRRYFCVIGLILSRLGMEIVSHESVHAGFCYAKRVRRLPWGTVHDFDEEHVAYPAGAIAAGIARFLYRKGFYK